MEEIFIKVGDRLILKDRIKEGKIIKDHWIWSCVKQDKQFKDILCCMQGEVCKIIKINKTNNFIQLYNENRKIFFKINKEKIKESEYNFKKV